MLFVAWIRKKQGPGRPRRWFAITAPLPEQECWDRLRANEEGDGGKLVLPEGQTPTLPRSRPVELE